jgi:ATP-binding cassette subfamily F protein uup
MLGRALVSEPDLLLLDEPTNHLDIEAITWLEDMMIDFNGALLFISHDRAFVRRLATRIVELDRGQLREWSGNYDDLRPAETRCARCRGQACRTVRQEARAGGSVDSPGRRGATHAQRGPGARAQAAAPIERRERRERIGQVDFKVQDAARRRANWCSKRGM